MSKLLTVFGATGNQGGSVIRSVLRHPATSTAFKVRGITRDPAKLASQKLADKGVEMVKGDLLDKDSLRSALKGSHSVYLVTNYWESLSLDTEVTQGKNVADVCKEIGVKHLIWSNLPDVNKLSGGKYPNVLHFDGKATVGEYIKSLGIPYTFFIPGFYSSNLKSMIQRDEASGSYSLTFPVPATAPFPFFDAAEDSGKFVSSILAKREQTIGTTVLGATGWYSPNQVVDIFKKVTGKELKYQSVSGEDFKKAFVPEFLAQEMLENFYLIRDYKYFGGADPEADLEKSLALLDEKPTPLEESIKSIGPWA